MEKTMKYNPAFLTDEELIAGFVVRTKELESILGIIRENTSGSNQHILVEGPRGSGKTTLVRRVAAEIRKDGKLKQKWYPILFAEESYMVQTPGEFWLEAIFHLEDQVGDAKWGQVYRELKEEKDETRLREGCLAKLIDFANQQKKRLILVVENMQMILGDEVSDDDAWVLRKTLLHEPKIMLLCTSLAGWVEDFKKESKAMYELFKRVELKPLSDAESKALWEFVAGKPIIDNRIRPINILTGGNPRLVSIISKFGKDMSFRDLMDNLIQLVDDNTGYFKGHLDSIAPMERKIYLALAEIWDPTTAKEVASVARIDVNKTSAILGKLERQGDVAVVGQKSRKKFYQISERMYNIYYLMRRHGKPSSRVKAIVRFIINFYSKSELADVINRIVDEAISIDPEKRQDFFQLYEAILHEPSCSCIREKIVSEKACLIYEEEIKRNPNDIIKLKNGGYLLLKRGSYDKAFELFQQILKLDTNDHFANENTGYILATHYEKYEEAEKVLKKATETNPDCPIAWRHLGCVYAEMAKYEEAEEAFKKALSLDCDDANIWGNLAKMYSKGDFKEKAQESYEKALKLEPQKSWIWENYGEFLEKEKKYKEAEKAYKKAFSLNNKVICSLAYLGRLAIKTGKDKQAIEYFEKTLKEHGSCTTALFYLGQVYLRQKKYKEAEAIFIKACHDYTEGVNLANILCYLSLAKIKLEKYTEAIAEIQNALKNAKDKEDVDLLTSVFIILSSCGYERKCLEILDSSEIKEKFEPLIVALKIHLGEEAVVAEEIMKIAKDVLARIQAEAENIQKEKKKTGS